MYFSTSHFALALGLIPGLVSAAGFFGSCNENNLWYSTLNGHCTGGWASIDLNQGISNVNGELGFGGSGFYGSCGSSVGGSCDLQYATLECDCRKDDGSNIRATINLDEGISYRNGLLSF